MAGTYRASPSALEFFAALEREPFRFDFFHALRRIECLHATLPRLGRAQLPRDEPLRLGQPPSLTFAPATIAHFVSSTATGVPRMEVLFLGLLGPHGALPTHLTEFVHDRARHHDDPTLVRFLDIFHHRMLLFFFRAWGDARAVVGRDRRTDDKFGRHLAALSGRSGAEFANRDEMPDDAKLHFTGHLAAIARRPSALRTVLTALLGVPIQILDFFARWLELPENGRWRLGRSQGFSVLGQTAIVGGRVFDAQSGVRLIAGPLSLAQYESYLPGSKALRALIAIMKNLLGDEYEWDLNLSLAANEVPTCRLGGEARLGWTSWLGTRASAEPAMDLVLRPARG